MTDNDYPVYEPGQTLTATELNTTTTYLNARDRLLCRLIGFGINCGLGGTVVSQTKLTIDRGLAIDQAGQGLALLADSDVPLPPTSVTPSYDFISATPGGFSIVLEATDTIATPPPCGEANCGGHPKIHTSGVTLRVVEGQITGTWMDFDTETLLNVTPMRLNPTTGKAIGNYTTLRDKIATRLTNNGDPLVETALITKLQGTNIADPGDLPAAVGYKCGWLNMVLFATLDLLRCEALCELAADRTTTRNGVVLGWVHLVSGDWVFDCSYRHAWEPPRGFTEAYLGGTCVDPCALYRNKLEAILGTYAPPEPPPAGGGGQPPVVDYCPNGVMASGECWPTYYPPLDIPGDWSRHWYDPVIKDPKIPIWNPPHEINPSIVYETDDFNNYFDGYMHGGGLVGHPGSDAQAAVVKVIEQHGGQASVLVVNATELSTMSGYAPTEGFSPSDTIVLTVGSDNTVIGTGRVSAIQTARKMGAALPAAINAANVATTAAAGIEQTVAGFKAEVSGFGAQMKGFTEDVAKLHGEFDGVKGFSDRLIKMEGSVEVLSVRSVSAGHAQNYDVGFSRAVSEFAKTTVVAMRSVGNNANDPKFERNAVAAERAQLDLEQAVSDGDPGALNVATVQVLSAMRTLVKGSGVDAAAGRELDSQVRGLQEMIR